MSQKFRLSALFYSRNSSGILIGAAAGAAMAFAATPRPEPVAECEAAPVAPSVAVVAPPAELPPLPAPLPPELCRVQDGYRIDVEVTARTKDNVSVSFAMAVRIRNESVEDWSRRSKTTPAIIAAAARESAAEAVGAGRLVALDGEGRIGRLASGLSRAGTEPVRLSLHPPEGFAARVARGMDQTYNGAASDAGVIEPRAVLPFTVSLDDGRIDTTDPLPREQVQGMARSQRRAAMRARLESQ